MPLLSRTSGHLRRITAGAAVLLASLFVSEPARTQDMDVPVAMQISLFVKVLAFDRQLEARAGEPLVIGIAYQGGNRVSSLAKDEAARALAAESLGPARPTLRIVAIDLDTADVARVLAEQRINVLYVAPLRGADIGALAAVTRTARTRTLTGVPQYVARGLAVGVARRGERPKLLVNLRAARLEGSDFAAEFLKLAELIR